MLERPFSRKNTSNCFLFSMGFWSPSILMKRDSQLKQKQQQQQKHSFFPLHYTALSEFVSWLGHSGRLVTEANSVEKVLKSVTGHGNHRPHWSCTIWFHPPFQCP